MSECFNCSIGGHVVNGQRLQNQQMTTALIVFGDLRFCALFPPRHVTREHMRTCDHSHQKAPAIKLRTLPWLELHPSLNLSFLVRRAAAETLDYREVGGGPCSVTLVQCCTRSSQTGTKARSFISSQSLGTSCHQKFQNCSRGTRYLNVTFEYLNYKYCVE